MSIKKAQVTRSQVICDGCNGEIIANMGEQFETITRPDGTLEHYHTRAVSGAMKNCRIKKESEDELIKIRKEQNLSPTDVIGTDHYDNKPILRSEEPSIFKSNDGKIYRNITTYRQETEDMVTGQETVAVRKLQRAQQEELAKKRKQIAESFGMTEDEFREAWS